MNKKTLLERAAKRCGGHFMVVKQMPGSSQWLACGWDGTLAECKAWAEQLGRTNPGVAFEVRPYSHFVE